MRYHVLLSDPDRPHPRHVAWIDADDDDHARRIVAEKWPGEDDLRLVRQDGLRLVWLREGEVRSAADLAENPPTRAGSRC